MPHNPDLLPCPFCSAPGTLEPGRNDHGYTAACASLDCPMWLVETRTFDTPEAAAAAWNTRIVQPVVA